MPNAAGECNSPREGRSGPARQAVPGNRWPNSPNVAGPGSPDCKSGGQGPIRARTC
jgi:hypothetical protein